MPSRACGSPTRSSGSTAEAVAETLAARGSSAVQTPQAIARRVLRDALDLVRRRKRLRRDGRGPRRARSAVEGNRRLLKVTDGKDLALVSTWLGVTAALPIAEDEFDDDEDDDDEDDEAEDGEE